MEGRRDQLCFIEKIVCSIFKPPFWNVFFVLREKHFIACFQNKITTKVALFYATVKLLASHFSWFYSLLDFKYSAWLKFCSHFYATIVTFEIKSHTQVYECCHHISFGTCTSVDWERKDNNKMNMKSLDCFYISHLMLTAKCADLLNCNSKRNIRVQSTDYTKAKKKLFTRSFFLVLPIYFYFIEYEFESKQMKYTI